MKTITLSTFTTREQAEKAINLLHMEYKIENDKISYLYKNTEGEINEVDVEDITQDTVKEGAEKGAHRGAALGAVAGIAAVAVAAPVVGPVLAGGSFAATLAASAAVGATAGSSAVGAVTGSLIGALYSWSFDIEETKEYEDRVLSGDVLVAVSDEDSKSDDVRSVLASCGAKNVKTYDVNLG